MKTQVPPRGSHLFCRPWPPPPIWSHPLPPSQLGPVSLFSPLHATSSFNHRAFTTSPCLKFPRLFHFVTFLPFPSRRCPPSTQLLEATQAPPPLHSHGAPQPPGQPGPPAGVTVGVCRPHQGRAQLGPCSGAILCSWRLQVPATQAWRAHCIPASLHPGGKAPSSKLLTPAGPCPPAPGDVCSEECLFLKSGKSLNKRNSFSFSRVGRKFEVHRNSHR